jgi:hypothetical protein
LAFIGHDNSNSCCQHSAASASKHQPALRCCAARAAHRLKDIIYGFGTNNVYVVLECMDCDLRHLLDADRQLEMRQIKVSTPSLLSRCWAHPANQRSTAQHCSESNGQPLAFVCLWHVDRLSAIQQQKQ